MSNKHCRNLSNQYELTPDGRGGVNYKPCCQYRGNSVRLDLREHFQQVKDIFNSAERWLPGCSVCQQMEQSNAHGVSYRLQSFDRTPEDYDHNDCVSLDVSLELECNAACITCGPHVSSTWAKIEKKISGKSYPILDLQSTGTLASDLYLQQIIDYVPLDKLRLLLVKGGEPLLTDFHKKLMAHIVSVHPDPKQVSIRYNTNCSVFPDNEVLQLWDQFKEIRINLSLDGIGERFEYIRWPLKWDKVERNVHRFINETNAKFVVHCTVSPLNLLYLNELQEWADKNIPTDRVHYKFGPVIWTRCYGVLDLNKTPLTMQEVSCKLYGEDHSVNKILKSFNDRDDLASALQFLDTHDRIRLQNWRTTFPDAVPYLE